MGSKTYHPKSSITVEEDIKRLVQDIQDKIRLDLKNIEVGDSVQVQADFEEINEKGIGSERFWCTVEEVSGDELIVNIDNMLNYTNEHGLRYRDKMKIERDDVIGYVKYAKVTE